MKGTANVPAKKTKEVTLESLGAQAKLKGTAGQFVGFDENGNAVSQDAPGAAAHAESHKTGGSDELSPSDFGAQTELKGTQGQYVGFNEKGEAVAKNPLRGTESQYIGFDENGNQVVKDLPENNGGGEGESSASSTAAFFGTIGTEWTEDEETGVKSQLVEIEGVLASHTLGVLDAIMTHDRTTEGYAAFVEEQNQFLDFITNGDAETVDGGVMFYIYGDANTVEIPFSLVVI